MDFQARLLLRFPSASVVISQSFPAASFSVVKLRKEMKPAQYKIPRKRKNKKGRYLNAIDSASLFMICVGSKIRFNSYFHGIFVSDKSNC